MNEDLVKRLEGVSPSNVGMSTGRDEHSKWWDSLSQSFFPQKKNHAQIVILAKSFDSRELRPPSGQGFDYQTDLIDKLLVALTSMRSPYEPMPMTARKLY